MNKDNLKTDTTLFLIEGEFPKPPLFFCFYKFFNSSNMLLFFAAYLTFQFVWPISAFCAFLIFGILSFMCGTIYQLHIDQWYRQYWDYKIDILANELNKQCNDYLFERFAQQIEENSQEK